MSELSKAYVICPSAHNDPRPVTARCQRSSEWDRPTFFASGPNSSSHAPGAIVTDGAATDKRPSERGRPTQGQGLTPA